MFNKGFISATLAIIVGLVLLGTGLFATFNYIETIGDELGATLFVTASPTKLGGSGVAATDTTVNLVKLRTPADNKITMSNFGDVGYGTIEPARTNKEFISFTSVTQNADGTATLTGVTRGLNFVSPYKASSTLRKSHPGGAGFVISNPPQLLDSLISKQTDSFVTSTVTFSVSAFPRMSASSTDPTDDRELTHKFYVDSLTAAGAAAATESVAGIGIFSTQAELILGTATGTFSSVIYNLFPQNRFFSATPGSTTTVVVTEADGDIAAGFIGQDQAYTWTAAHSFSAGITSTGAFVQTATATFSGNTTLSGTITIGTSTLNGTMTLSNADIVDSLGDSVINGMQLIFTTSTDKSLSDTTSETFMTTTTISGNTIHKNGGLLIRVNATWGTSGAGNGSANLYVNYGGTRICTFVGNFTTATAGAFTGECVMYGNNSTSSQISFTDGVNIGGTSAIINDETTSSVDVTQDQFLSLSGQRGGGTSMGTLVLKHYAIFKFSN